MYYLALIKDLTINKYRYNDYCSCYGPSLLNRRTLLSNWRSNDVVAKRELGKLAGHVILPSNLAIYGNLLYGSSLIG